MTSHMVRLKEMLIRSSSVGFNLTLCLSQLRNNTIRPDTGLTLKHVALMGSGAVTTGFRHLIRPRRMEQDIGATFRRLGVIYAADDAVSVDMNVLGIPLGVNVEPALIDSGRKFIDIELELVGKFPDLGSDDVYQSIERGVSKSILPFMIVV